jgi:hypothetical protein
VKELAIDAAFLSLFWGGDGFLLKFISLAADETWWVLVITNVLREDWSGRNVRKRRKCTG